jgi:hypothetical protein
MKLPRLRRILIPGLVLGGAIAGIALALIGAFAWAFWPLPDPRFDWKPYEERLLAKGDCHSTSLLLSLALNTYETDAARAAIALPLQPACAGSEYAEEVARISQNGARMLQILQDPRSRAKFERRRAAGWPRVWYDRGGVWFFFTLYLDEYAKNRSSPLDLAAAPFSALGRLHCDYSLFDGPSGSYFLMRVELAREHGFNELRLPVWERRVFGCFDPPVKAGYFLYRPLRKMSAPEPQ